jgi:hypothetical protein
MRRHWLVVWLALLMGLQGSTIGYAMSVEPHSGMAGMPAIPSAVHGAMLHADHGDCCPHHSTHSVPVCCLAHCAGVAALLPTALTIPLNAVRVTADPLAVMFSPSERPGPALRPPIIHNAQT